MGEPSLLDRIRGFIGSCAWRVLLWANRMKDVEYWAQIGVDVLSEMPCSCEDSGRWNKDCPEHGEVRQSLEGNKS